MQIQISQLATYRPRDNNHEPELSTSIRASAEPEDQSTARNHCRPLMLSGHCPGRVVPVLLSHCFVSSRIDDAPNQIPIFYYFFGNETRARESFLAAFLAGRAWR
jgi:hypothetical protein